MAPFMNKQQILDQIESLELQLATLTAMLYELRKQIGD